MISSLNISSAEPGEKLAENLQVSTELLLEKVRKSSRELRVKQRSQSCDALRFGLGEIKSKMKELDNLNEMDICGLAARIKRRKHASLKDMYRLNHAFLQSGDNIVAFAKIPGAIQVLVKELTGNDAERQVSACESLCNMSLSGAPVCEKVATMAGSYLITYLSSSSDRLKQTALWTLANILATDECKGAYTLIQMELLPKLWNLYTEDDHGSATGDGHHDDAAICLNLISMQATQLLRKDDRIYIMHNLHKKNPTSASSEYHLKIIFNCEIINKDVMLTEGNSLYLINYALSNLANCEDFTSTANRLKVVYALRVLNNLLASQSMPQIINLFLHQLSTVWQTNLTSILIKLFAWRNDELMKESLCLLKTLLEQQYGASTAEYESMETSYLRKLLIYMKDETQDTTHLMDI